jgi:uncharacterized protein YqjF (DUF2071 family)
MERKRMTTPGIFLTAEWRYLVMLNFEIDPAVLVPFVPRGTELDTWQGRTLVSVVGFLFQRTRVFGMAVPRHQEFEEVNLRFYVRRQAAAGPRRGVVFVKEIVPRWAIATVARLLYNERYVALPMRHTLDVSSSAPGVVVEYGWQAGGRWQHVRATGAGEPRPIAAGSEAEFITEHYWGYTVQRDGGSLEFAVEHPRWRVWPATDVSLDVDAAALYGSAFGASLSALPCSAFIAEGSPIVVRRGVRLTLDP